MTGLELKEAEEKNGSTCLHCLEVRTMIKIRALDTSAWVGGITNGISCPHGCSVLLNSVDETANIVQAVMCEEKN